MLIRKRTVIKQRTLNWLEVCYTCICGGLDCTFPKRRSTQLARERLYWDIREQSEDGVYALQPVPNKQVLLEKFSHHGQKSLNIVSMRLGVGGQCRTYLGVLRMLEQPIEDV